MKKILYKFVLLILVLITVASCVPGSIAQTSTSIPATQANTAVPATQTSTAVPATQANTAVPTTPAISPTPGGIQSLPNMGQQISPLVIKDSRFENLNPDLADNPDWLAGHAVTIRGEPG